MTNPTLERIASAIAKSAGSGVIADLSVEGEPFTAVLLDGCFDLNEFASAALQALKSLDDSTVEAMAEKLHAYDWNGVVNWADETDEIKGQYRERVTFAVPAGLTHILEQDHDAK